MKCQLQNNKKVLLLLFLLFFLSGCSSLKTLDQKLGETFFNEKTSEIKNEKKIEKKEELNSKNLDLEVKKKIDNWLKENNLNKYGDPEGTYYIGGTPLFNEKTGESMERFEYIFKKIPDILEKIK